MPRDTRRTVLLAGLFLGLFFAALDQTVVGTAMPRIIGDLGGLAIMTWVTTAYMLTSTAIVPIAGKLADLYGRRSIYVAGLLIFMAASVLCGLARDMTHLIAARGLQGVGGGIMMPLSMTIVGDIFPPDERGKWQGLIGAVFGLASIVGPTIGGWLVDYASWPWVFFVNLPLGLLAAAAIHIGLKYEKPLKDRAVIDYAGAASLVVATVALLLGLNLGGTDYPWLSWPIAALLGLSLAAWTIFIIVEKRVAEPILDLALFQNRIFFVTNLIGFLLGLGMFGAIIFLPLFLQGVLGASATGSGNAMIPMMLAMVATSILAGRFAARLAFRDLFIAGMAVMAAGFYLLATMTVHTTQLTATLYIVLLGLGMGLIMPTVTLAVQSAFPAEQRGVATSATQFFRSIGGTLGITLLGVIFNNHSLAVLQNLAIPLPAPLLATARTDPHALFNTLLSPAALAAIPADTQAAILPPLRAALADSLHTVFLVAMAFVIAGILASLLLGDARLETRAPRPAAQDAGVTLFAEGMAVEGEIAAELIPDLIAGDRPRKTQKSPVD